MNINATFEESIFAAVTCVMDTASNPSALMPLKTCSSVMRAEGLLAISITQVTEANIPS